MSLHSCVSSILHIIPFCKFGGPKMFSIFSSKLFCHVFCKRMDLFPSIMLLWNDCEQEFQYSKDLNQSNKKNTCLISCLVSLFVICAVPGRGCWCSCQSSSSVVVFVGRQAINHGNPLWLIEKRGIGIFKVFSCKF